MENGHIKITIWLRDPNYEYTDIALLIDMAENGDLDAWSKLVAYIAAGHSGLMYHFGTEEEEE